MKICESFRSLQGEGKKIGVITHFVRVAGCNLRCSWCDTQYAVFGDGKEMSVDDIVSDIGEIKNVCVTGGEPMIYEETIDLLKKLLAIGKTIVLETNGSISLNNVPDSDNIVISMDIKCPSSKMKDKMNFSNIALLKKKDQLKFIISNGIDLAYSIDIMNKYPPECEVIFTPVGGMDIEPLAEEVIERGLNVRVLPQLHKLIWGNKKGV
ncbi:MAG: radical SAM protein [archaeon]|nr:radical SAM protein [archaeon]